MANRLTYFVVDSLEDPGDPEIRVVKATGLKAHKILLEVLDHELNVDDDQPTFDPNDVYSIEEVKPVLAALPKRIK